ncbi:DUF5060 domain-containing protein [bacterium]|nr:DUF5060 domain-containing protein [bacterium]
MKPLLCIGMILMAAPFAAQGEPAVLRVRTAGDTVGLFEKFELQVGLDAVFINPFDPEEITVTALFTSPSGKKAEVDGFFAESWSPWVIRFSPWEAGTWTYQVTVRDRTGRAESAPAVFFAKPSAHHGPVRISPVNNRYLEHRDETPFYGVGLWFNGGLRESRSGEPGTAEVLDELKDLGVNFISTILPRIETIATGCGRYDQALCGRMDQLLAMLEERDMLLSLNIWFHSFLSETVWPGGNRQWHNNPYRQFCKAKDFYSSGRAWDFQEKMYRYIIARWSYSRALAVWFIVDEVNGTDGWVSGDSLGAARWGRRVHDYFKAHDPYGHLTTGTRSGGIAEWWHEGYRIFDLAAREIYEAQGFPILTDGRLDPGDPNPLRLSYWNYVGEIRKLWDGYGKPAIIGETGWDHTFFEFGTPGYLSLYHNALWAGLSSGLAMTPFWWSYSRRINESIVTSRLRSISDFTSGIPFSRLTHVSRADATLSGGDAFAVKSDQLVFGWAVDPDADVAADTVTVKGLPDGDYRLKMYHTWRGKFFHQDSLACRGGSISFTVPVLRIEDSHAGYVGQDVAFILERLRAGSTDR